MHSCHVHALWELAGELRATSPRLEELLRDRDTWVAQHLQPTMPNSDEGDEGDEGYESFKQLVLAVLNGKAAKAG